MNQQVKAVHETRLNLVGVRENLIEWSEYIGATQRSSRSWEQDTENSLLYHIYRITEADRDPSRCHRKRKSKIADGDLVVLHRSNDALLRICREHKLDCSGTFDLRNRFV